MKKKNLIVIAFASTTLAIGGGVALTSAMSPKAIEVKAGDATNTTVYLALADATLSANGANTVKLNVNRKGDGEDWQQYTMTKTADTFDSMPVYSCNFTDLYGGLGKMQFQLYNGSTWKAQDVPISSWTEVGNYNGKLHVYGESGWIDKNAATFTVDTLYVTRPNDDWGNTLYAYAWRGGKTNASWPGKAMTKVSTNEHGQDVYSISGISGYVNIIFSGGSEQTVDGDAGSFGANNACWLGNEDNNKYPFAGYYTYSVDRANLINWARSFVDESDDLCNGTGKEWSDYAATYTDLDAAAKAYFTTAQVTASQEGDVLQRAAYRYEYGVSVRNKTAFAESQRPKTGFQANYSAALRLSHGSSQGDVTTAIAVTAAIGVGAAVGMVFIRRRRVL